MKYEQRKKKERSTNIQTNDERMMHEPLCINEEENVKTIDIWLCNIYEPKKLGCYYFAIH